MSGDPIQQHTAFMSYSHDSDDHRAWVVRLATDIRANGIEATLDHWHLRPGEALGAFMARAVKGSSKVVVVCSARYVTKAEAQLGGAGYEGALVTAELVRDQGTSRFIPVLRGNPEGVVPAFLDGRLFIDFRNEDEYEKKLTELLRALHDLPPVDPPPIGASPFQSVPPAAVPVSARSGSSSGLAGEIEALLEDPSKRISLSKKLWVATERAREQVAAAGLFEYGVEPTAVVVAQRVAAVETALAPVVSAYATMGRWATSEQIPLLTSALTHLLDVPEADGRFYPDALHLASYPAIRCLYAAGLGALEGERFDNLRAILMASSPARRNESRDLPFAAALHREHFADRRIWKRLPGKEQRYTPMSDQLSESLRAEMAIANEDRWNRGFDRFEAIVALAYLDGNPKDEWGWIPIGAFVWRRAQIFRVMAEELSASGVQWPLLKAGFFGGAEDRAREALEHAHKFLVEYRFQAGVH